MARHRGGSGSSGSCGCLLWFILIACILYFLVTYWVVALIIVAAVIAIVVIVHVVKENEDTPKYSGTGNVQQAGSSVRYNSVVDDVVTSKKLFLECKELNGPLPGSDKAMAAAVVKAKKIADEESKDERLVHHKSDVRVIVDDIDNPSFNEMFEQLSHAGSMNMTTTGLLANYNAITIENVAMKSRRITVDSAMGRCYILPSMILRYSPEGRYVRSYTPSAMNVTRTSTSQTGISVPAGAEIDSQRWMYQRKDGGPDMRRTNNPLYKTYRIDHVRVSIDGIQGEIEGLNHAATLDVFNSIQRYSRTRINEIDRVSSLVGMLELVSSDDEDVKAIRKAVDERSEGSGNVRVIVIDRPRSEKKNENLKALDDKTEPETPKNGRKRSHFDREKK